MNTKHTPGPWRAVGCHVADCWCGVVESDALPDDHDHKTVIPAGSASWDDAVLIAAAPELLHELRAVLEWAITEKAPLRKQEIASIRAAIAKATGESA